MWEDLQSVYADGLEGMVGPGNSQYSHYAELAKALQAGSGAGLGSVDARALVMEDLEPTLKTTTFGDRQFTNTLWRHIKAKTEEATAIMHEFARLEGYGETGGFSPEITTSLQAIDAEMSRGYVQIRFLRNKRAISKVIKMTKTISNAESIQVLAGTRYLMQTIERYLYDGDSTMTPDEWDGLAKLCPAANIVDMAGAKLGESHLDDAAGLMADSYGVPSHMFHNNKVQTSLDQNLIGGQNRILQWDGAGQQPPFGIPAGFGNVGNNAGMAGFPVAGYRSSFGNIKFQPHTFVGMRQASYKDRAGTEVATHASAPATPTTLAIAVASQSGAFAGSGTGGILTAGKYSGVYAGTYRYRVSSENSLGESIPCAAVTATVTAAQKATLTWDAMSGATCYRIYRSPAGGPAASEVLIARVVAIGSPTYVDINQSIALCSNVYLLDLDSEGELKTCGWAQLAPMSRDILPPADTTLPWIQFIYGAFLAYSTSKIRMFKNVGLY